MRKTVIHIQTLLLMAAIFVLTSAVFIELGTERVEAQGILSTLLGGTTGGVRYVCCNGVVLNFNSINPGNPNILDGQALWVPGVTRSYDHTREFLPGFCTVGKLIPGACMTVSSGCSTPRPMPIIQEIGTGGALCKLGL